MEQFCLIDDCPGAVVARSLCTTHYGNWRKYGTPLPEVRCVECASLIDGATMRTKRCAPCAAERTRELEREAAARARRERKSSAPKRDCPICATDITMRRGNVKFCSDFCSDRSRGIQLLGPWAERECALEDCSDTFTTFRGSTRCCSERHGKRLWNRESRADGRQQNPAWDDRRRNNYHKRRALRAGSTAGPAFTNADVFERDGWVCGLCDESVSPDAVYPDPLSASLDHVVPLSRGGAHSFSNSQLAHLSCNVRKGAREDVSVMA